MGDASCCGGDKARPVCCGGVAPAGSPGSRRSLEAPWVDGAVDGACGPVPRVRTRLELRDRVGSFKARWGIGRMDYRVPPGLYAAGNPGSGSPVLLSANYKMSFNGLRGAIAGRDAWILVLDTDGINVWCAAGKGTFGTDEIVRRVRSAAVGTVVSHRTLVVPQLGAPGVSAHEVRRRCGFRVEYGPVRAADLPAFLDAGMKARPEMRRVRFGLRDRAVLIPVELVGGARYALLAAALFLLLGGVSAKGYALEGVLTAGSSGAGTVLGVFLGATILGPLLLPWLPGRAFSVKGAALGLALAAAAAVSPWIGPLPGWSGWRAAAWFLMVPAVASFVVMNFTGATTFTSLSGVKREIRLALPAQIVAAAIGLGVWLIGLFVPGGGGS